MTIDVYDGRAFWAASETKQELTEVRRCSSRALWSSMTLAGNISLALQQYTDLGEAEIREVAAYKLMLVGLAGFEDYANEISGGMKKRAGLARAMALDPKSFSLTNCISRARPHQREVAR